jgi:hypothetical protein
MFENLRTMFGPDRLWPSLLLIGLIGGVGLLLALSMSSG